MATFTKRGDGQWQAKIRRKGWPAQSATFKTKKLAESWAHRIESEMAAGHFVDRVPRHRKQKRRSLAHGLGVGRMGEKASG